MNNSIKQLQKNNGVKKEFSFLSKVSDYIAKEYGEISHLFDTNNVNEVLSEIQKINPSDVRAAYYCSLEDLVFVNNYSYISISLKDRNKQGLDNMYFEHGRSTVKLDDLYYISDIEKYDEYLENNRINEANEAIKREEERLQKKKEKELKLQEQVKLDLAIRKEFGLSRDEDTSKAIAYKEFAVEVLGKKEDLKNGFIKFKKLMKGNYDFDLADIEEISWNCAKEAVNDHYYDEH